MKLTGFPSLVSSLSFSFSRSYFPYDNSLFALCQPRGRSWHAIINNLNPTYNQVHIDRSRIKAKISQKTCSQNITGAVELQILLFNIQVKFPHHKHFGTHRNPLSCFRTTSNDYVINYRLTIMSFNVSRRIQEDNDFGSRFSMFISFIW